LSTVLDTMQQALSILAGLIALGAYLPYAADILKGRVQTARSSRIMFVLLLLLTTLQQNAVHSGLLVMVTAGELVGSCGILILSLRHGEGGMARLDKLCYLMLAADILLWVNTGSALLALHLSALADLVAFTPTLVKTWRRPHTETRTFYIIGTVAPALNIAASDRFSYSVLLFPVYLVLANLAEVFLIAGRSRRHSGSSG